MKLKIQYRKGFKYQLAYNYRANLGSCPPIAVTFHWFSISEDGEITIKRGYAWDGASGPGIDTKTIHRGALVHDVLYQCMRLELLPKSYRQTADEIMREICLEDGMSRIRAAWIYYGLRLAGGFAANKKNKREVLSAP